MADETVRRFTQKMYGYQPSIMENARIYELQEMAQAFRDQGPAYGWVADVLDRRARHIQEGDPAQNPFLDDLENFE